MHRRRAHLLHTCNTYVKHHQLRLLRVILIQNPKPDMSKPLSEDVISRRTILTTVSRRLSLMSALVIIHHRWAQHGGRLLLGFPMNIVIISFHSYCLVITTFSYYFFIKVIYISHDMWMMMRWIYYIFFHSYCSSFSWFFLLLFYQGRSLPAGHVDKDKTCNGLC